MRKLSAVITGIAMLAAISCSKTEAPQVNENESTVYKNVDVVINQGESYSYELPGEGYSEFEITSQALNFTTSTISENVYSEKIYLYKPALNFYGTDKIIISGEKQVEHHGGNSHNGGGCSHNNNDKKEEIVITINITVNQNPSSPGKSIVK